MNLAAPLFRTGRRLQDELSEAPNPKPTARDKASFGKLANLYTAFSRDFAEYALDICLRSGFENIADPFSGMGTLAEAARSRPVSLRLGDISPFATLSGVFRSATHAEIEESAVLLETLAGQTSAQDEREFFTQVFSILADRSQTSTAALLTSPSEPEYRIAALALFLAALSRIRLYKRFSGSNPTWVRRPDNAADIASTFDAIEATVSAAREFSQHLPDLHPANRTTCTWSSIDVHPIMPGSLDAVLTSPPYANRTDYIRHYLPASELLLAAAGHDERLTRTQQIGTPLIRASEPKRPLPSSVLNVLEEIRTHSSYASKRYYSKGFLYYFADMHDALLAMHRWLRDGGLLLMVVQDSYYKNIYVPTADLLTDLAEAIGFQLAGRHDWRVLRHLSLLSPHSRQFARNRPLCESVIALSK